MCVTVEHRLVSVIGQWIITRFFRSQRSTNITQLLLYGTQAVNSVGNWQAIFFHTQQHTLQCYRLELYFVLISQLEKQVWNRWESRTDDDDDGSSSFFLWPFTTTCQQKSIAFHIKSAWGRRRKIAWIQPSFSQTLRTLKMDCYLEHYKMTARVRVWPQKACCFN